MRSTPGTAGNVAIEDLLEDGWDAVPLHRDVQTGVSARLSPIRDDGLRARKPVGDFVEPWSHARLFAQDISHATGWPDTSNPSKPGRDQHRPQKQR